MHVTHAKDNIARFANYVKAAELEQKTLTPKLTNKQLYIQCDTQSVVYYNLNILTKNFYICRSSNLTYKRN